MNFNQLNIASELFWVDQQGKEQTRKYYLFGNYPGQAEHSCKRNWSKTKYFDFYTTPSWYDE